MKSIFHLSTFIHIFMYQLSQRLGQHTKPSLEKLDRNILGRQISKTKYLLLNRKEKKMSS